MKKYAGTIIFTVIIMLVISMFYIGTASADQDLPQFVIKKTAGPANESIEVYGTLSAGGSRWARAYRSLSVDGNQTQYSRSGLFNGGFDYETRRIVQLQKEYRNFMRNKDYSLASYFEDKEKIGYADIHTDEIESYLQISVLNKKNKDVNDFNVPLPKEVQDADYAHFEDVQIFDNEMKIIASISHPRDNYNREDVVLFTVDLKKRKITNVADLYKDKEGKQAQSTYIKFNNSTNTMQAAEHLVFSAVITESQIIDEDTGETTSKVTSRKYIDVNLKTGEKQEIESKALNENKMTPAFVKGNKLYAFQGSKGKLKVQVYDLDQQKELQSYKVEWPGGLNNTDIESWQISVQDGKLIILSPYIWDMNPSISNLPQILIVDEKDGKLRWQGVVMPKKSTNLEECDFNIDGFKVK